MTDEPAGRAHALLEHLFAILHECRALVPQLERGPDGETPSAEAERLLYYALTGTIEEGGSRPYRGGCPQGAAPSERAAGTMGAVWLIRQRLELSPGRVSQLMARAARQLWHFSASREATLSLGDDGLGDHGALRLLGEDGVEVGPQVFHIERGLPVALIEP